MWVWLGDPRLVGYTPHVGIPTYPNPNEDRIRSKPLLRLYGEFTRLTNNFQFHLQQLRKNPQNHSTFIYLINIYRKGLKKKITMKMKTDLNTLICTIP